MALRGAGSAANTITAGTAAQQDDYITGLRTLTANIVRRSCAYNSTTLQALSGITVVIDFCNVTGSKTDLVAVGGVTGCSCLAQFPLGQLAGNGFVQGLPGICSAGDAHSLMDISTTGQRVTDTATDTGSCAAERLDFGGVVMGLILEHQEPILVLAVYLGIDVNRTGIDFLALVQLRKQTALFQCLCADGGNIHQCLGTLCSLLLAVDFHTGSQIPLISGSYCGIVNLHIVNDGGEGGVTAVVGPVGVNHTNLSDGGVTLFLVAEIVLQELQVIQIHSKTQLVQQVSQTLFVQTDEAVNSSNGLRDCVICLQGFGQGQLCLTAFHRVNHVFFDCGDFFLCQLAVQAINFSGSNQGTLALRDDLNTLGGRIGALVKLTRQRLYGKYNSTLQVILSGGNIQLRLGKHGVDCVMEQLLGDIFCIVAVQQTDILQRLNSQQVTGIIQKGLCLIGQLFFLFYIYSINQC